MNVTLSWDLLIILFVALVVAYSFIVGKEASIKIIVATYISLVAVEAIGDIALLLTNASTASMVGLSLPPDVLVIGKTVLFAVAVVFMAMKGGINIEAGGGFGTAWDIAVSAALGFSTAALLLASLVTYITGKPLLDRTLASADALGGVELTSPLVGAIVDYQHVWFALPAVILLVIGFVGSRESA
jgi:hypothetical protein